MHEDYKPFGNGCPFASLPQSTACHSCLTSVKNKQTRKSKFLSICFDISLLTRSLEGTTSCMCILQSKKQDYKATPQRKLQPTYHVLPTSVLLGPHNMMYEMCSQHLCYLYNSTFDH